MTRHQILGALAGILTGVLVVTGVVLVVQIYQLSEQNNQLNERIVDCTTPGRPCYQRGVQQTADAVVRLNDWTEAAVTCADLAGTQSRREIRTCILRLMPLNR